MEANSEQTSSSVNIVSSSLSTRNIHRRRNPAVLIQWIEEHPQNPYPNKSEKQFLAYYAGMSQRQLNDWFANARRNIKKIGYETWKRKHTGFSAMLSGIPQKPAERINFESSPLSAASSGDNTVETSCVSLSPMQCNSVSAREITVGSSPSGSAEQNYQPNVRPFQGPFALWGLPHAASQFRGHIPTCDCYKCQLPGAHQQPLPGVYEATTAWSGERTYPQLWNMSFAMAPEVNGYYTRIAPEVP
ncbi:hypothetical protein EMCRGX_G031687 [Ephydatia muelleri]